MEIKGEARELIKTYYNVDDETAEMIFLTPTQASFSYDVSFFLYAQISLIPARNPFFLFIFAFNAFCLCRVDSRCVNSLCRPERASSSAKKKGIFALKLNYHIASLSISTEVSLEFLLLPMKGLQSDCKPEEEATMS